MRHLRVFQSFESFFLTAAGRWGDEVYREQFVAGWQSTPLRFTFPGRGQRRPGAGGGSHPVNDSLHEIPTPIIPPVLSRITMGGVQKVKWVLVCLTLLTIIPVYLSKPLICCKHPKESFSSWPTSNLSSFSYWFSVAEAAWFMLHLHWYVCFFFK